MVGMTTGERLVAIETKLETISSDVNEIKKALKAHVEWENSRYDTMKNEFAAKWAEKALWAIILILIGIAFKVMVG